MSEVATDGDTRPGEDRAEEAVLRRRTLVPSARQHAAGDVERADAQVSVPVADDAEASGSTGIGAALKGFVASADPRRISGPTLPLVVLALTGTVAQWDDLALGVLAPEIRAEFGFSLAFVAGLASTMQLLTIALGLPFGYLADRVKRVWIVRIGSIVANLGSVGQGFAPNLGSLVVSRVGGGVGAAAILPTNLPLMTDYFGPSERTRVFSFFFAAGQLGVIAGPLLAGLLGARYGWRSAVVVLGATATLVSLTTFLLPEPVRGAVDRRAMGADEDLADREPDPVGFAEAYRTVANITTLRRFWFAAPFTVLATTGSLVLLGFYYSQVFALGPAARGQISAVSAAVGLVGLLVFGPIGDRILRTKPARLVVIAAVATVYQAVSMVALAVAPNVTVAVVVGIPVGAVSIALGPAFFTLISKIVPARIRGMGMQTQRPWELIGLLALPVVVGAATSAWGLKVGMLVFAPPLLIAAAIIASAASHIEEDIRNADAATLAEAEAQRLRREGATRALMCREVDVGYDGVQVLFGVDLDVEQGELVALLGTNGAGKSTLLKAIAGIQEASSGAIYFEGRDITHRPPHETAALGVVMMPGGEAVFGDLSVEENLRAALWLREGSERAEFTAAWRQVLEFFPELGERMKQPAGTLSGGEQQMVALSQAFLMEPELLMIDELSLGLAPAVVEKLLAILRRIHEGGTTVIIVEQSLNVAMAVAERVVFMEKGEIQFSGPTDKLLDRPDLVRSVFIGGGVGGASTSRRRRASGRAQERDAVVRAADVAVSFGGVQALRGVDLEVAPGEVLGIIGPNGAGKTTLFDAISGFVPVDRGQVWVEATPVTGAPVHERSRLGLGRSFQNARLFPTLTVRENIAVFMDRRAAGNPLLGALWAPPVRRAERKLFGRVDDLIELLGLQDYADKFAGELSTGSRRVVDVACVLAQNPSALLLDEPSSGLAQAETEALGPLLTRIVRDTGCGMVVIEHDVGLVSSVADRLLAMDLGEVIASGDAAAVLDDPAVRSAYLSASEGTIQRSGRRTQTIADALGVSDDHHDL